MAGRRPRHVALDGVEPADRRRLVRRGPGVSGAVTAGTRIVPGHGRSALGGSTRIGARRRRLTPRGSSLRLEQRFSAWDLRPADDGFLLGILAMTAPPRRGLARSGAATPEGLWGSLKMWVKSVQNRGHIGGGGCRSMSERVSPRKCGDGAALGRLVESGMSDECALTSGALRDARLDFPRAGGLRSSVETARNVQELAVLLGRRCPRRARESGLAVTNRSTRCCIRRRQPAHRGA